MKNSQPCGTLTRAERKPIEREDLWFAHICFTPSQRHRSINKTFCRSEARKLDRTNIQCTTRLLVAPWTDSVFPTRLIPRPQRYAKKQKCLLCLLLNTILLNVSPVVANYDQQMGDFGKLSTVSGVRWGDNTQPPASTQVWLLAGFCTPAPRLLDVRYVHPCMYVLTLVPRDRNGENTRGTMFYYFYQRAR